VRGHHLYTEKGQESLTNEIKYPGKKGISQLCRGVAISATIKTRRGKFIQGLAGNRKQGNSLSHEKKAGSKRVQHLAEGDRSGQQSSRRGKTKERIASGESDHAKLERVVKTEYYHKGRGSALGFSL